MAGAVLHADTEDDFHFTALHSPETETYHAMPTSRIEDVLHDNLEDYAVAAIPDLARHIVALCRKYRFDPAFVLSLIEVESGFRAEAVSPRGAVGLMQLMPSTAFHILRRYGVELSDQPEIVAKTELTPAIREYLEEALLNPFHNLSLGIAYLAKLRDRYDSVSPYYLLAAYNVGPNRMDALLSRKDFKPVNTKRYFEAIRRRVPEMRFYQRNLGSNRAAAITRDGHGV